MQIEFADEAYPRTKASSYLCLNCGATMKCAAGYTVALCPVCAEEMYKVYMRNELMNKSGINLARQPGMGQVQTVSAYAINVVIERSTRHGSLVIRDPVLSVVRG